MTALVDSLCRELKQRGYFAERGAVVFIVNRLTDDGKVVAHHRTVKRKGEVDGQLLLPDELLPKPKR